MSERPIPRYVVGFMLDEARQRVVLIRKNRPEWQAGSFADRAGNG